MKKVLLSAAMLGLFGSVSIASAADLGVALPPPPPPVVVVPELGFGKVPPVIVQIGPTTSYSTIQCAEFTKLPDGAWKSLGKTPFGLGFVQGIIPPARPIKVGGYIYNNIDLYSQLEEQCKGALVQARY